MPVIVPSGRTRAVMTISNGDQDAIVPGYIDSYLIINDELRVMFIEESNGQIWNAASADVAAKVM